MASTKTSSGKRSSPNTRKDSHPIELLKNCPDGITVLQVPLFQKFSWLVHGFSTSPGGVSSLHSKEVLNLGFTEWDERANVEKNRGLFLAAIQADDLALIPLKQFHSDVVCVFDSKPGAICSGDASITKTPNLLLGIQTADCVPVLLVDPKIRVVAAIHAGWRGTLHRIVEKTIGRMVMEFGSRPSDLLAAIGPAIGGCCYEVGTEVAAAFHSQFTQASEWFDELRTGDEPNPLQWLNQLPPGHQPPPKNVRLDLRKANRAQLVDKGVRGENIFVSELCTSCRPDLLFSYRKNGAESGRMMSVIGIRAD